MDPLMIALIVAVFTLIVLFSGIPIAFGLSFVSIALLIAFEGLQMLDVFAETFYAGLNSFVLLSIPMFILMGMAVAHSPAGKDLYTGLDRWLWRVPGGLVISNIGANVAIWNIKNYKILKRDNKIYIDDFPLIFYHFANLKQLNKNSFSTSLSRVFVSCEGLLKKEVYLPYLKEFLNHQNQDSISISKKDLHSKGFITFIRNCSRKVRLFFYNDIIKID